MTRQSAHIAGAWSSTGVSGLFAVGVAFALDRTKDTAIRERRTALETRGSVMPDLAAFLANPRLISTLGPEEAAEAILRLAELHAALASRLRQFPQRAAPANPSEPDRLLEPSEVAQRLGVKIRWLYSHADQLPFTKRLGRKVLRFSELGLRRYMARSDD
jgi:hypothetical protein